MGYLWSEDQLKWLEVLVFPSLIKAFHKAITGNLSKPSSLATSLGLVLGSFSYLNGFSSLKLRT
jgi:hypothetical protein